MARLCEAPEPGANTIAWLVWHTARVQDHHISELVEAEQLWVADDWARRFGLAPDADNTGYGHTPDDVASVRPEQPATLLDYLDATHQRALLAVPEPPEAGGERTVRRRARDDRDGDKDGEPDQS